MQIDQKTLHDLGVFHQQKGLYELLNLCISNEGSHWLKKYMQHPPQDFESLVDHQNAIQYWYENLDQWPEKITNGTLVMVDKYFSSTESIIAKPNSASIMVNKLIRNFKGAKEESFVIFSISLIMDFVKSCNELVNQHKGKSNSKILEHTLVEMEKFLSGTAMQNIIDTSYDSTELVLYNLSYHTRRNAKNSIQNLVQLFAILDGLHSLAKSTKENNWHFPILERAQVTTLKAEGFYHPLLDNAIPYDIHFQKNKNFLFLTGANMSGKSTLIRSIGLIAYMAHLGIGVAAKGCTISFLDNLITNMQIEDNLFKGESYFFAEVQRIKNTATQLLKSKHNLVLMDELFKGTNVHDAYDCSESVIKAMSESEHNLMALSTHLYELADKFKETSNIHFAYCETIMNEDGTYRFTYQLKEGVSNDRIGYLVLKKEGVLEILDAIEKQNN